LISSSEASSQDGGSPEGQHEEVGDSNGSPLLSERRDAKSRIDGDAGFGGMARI